MGKTKTSKSFTKRIRITKNGKVMRRPTGVNHFKTRKNANGVRGKRGTMTLAISAKRMSALTN